MCIGLYGCELWNLESLEMKELSVAWRVCCRRVLGLHPRTHCNLIPALIGTRPVKSLLDQRILTFVQKCLNHENKLVQDVINNVLIENFSYVKRNINIIIDSYKIRYCDLFNERLLRIDMSIDTYTDWKTNIITELINCRDGIAESILNFEEINHVIYDLCVN